MRPYGTNGKQMSVQTYADLHKLAGKANYKRGMQKMAKGA